MKVIISNRTSHVPDVGIKWSQALLYARYRITIRLSEGSKSIKVQVGGRSSRETRSWLADSAVKFSFPQPMSSQKPFLLHGTYTYHQLSESRQFAGHLRVLRLSLCSLFANGTFSILRRTVR